MADSDTVDQPPEQDINDEEPEEELDDHDQEPAVPEPPVEPPPKPEPPKTAPSSPADPKGGQNARKATRTRRAKHPANAQNANSAPPAQETKVPAKRDADGSPKKEKKSLLSPPSVDPDESEEEYEPSALVVTLCCALEAVWNSILNISRCAYRTTRSTLRLTKKFLPTMIGLFLFYTTVWVLRAYCLPEPDHSLVATQNARNAFTVLSLTYTLWPAALAVFVCQWWGDVDQQRFLYESFQEAAMLWMNAMVFYHYVNADDMFWLRTVLFVTGIFRMFHWLSLRYCGVWCQRITAAPTLNIVLLTLYNLYNVACYDLGYLHQPEPPSDDAEQNQPEQAPGWSLCNAVESLVCGASDRLGPRSLGSIPWQPTVGILGTKTQESL